MWGKLLVFSVLLASSYCKHEQYDGHSLYEVTVSDVSQTKVVNEIQNAGLADVWSYPNPSRPGQILVSPESKENFESVLSVSGIKYKIIVDNIKDAIEYEEASRQYRKSLKVDPDFSTILEFEEVEAYLRRIAAAYPNVATLVNAGKSVEGRDLWYLKISSSNFQNSSKPIVFVQSLLHAREWVTLPASIYAIHKLVVDVTEQDLLQDIDWIIMPVANPDGYVFSHVDSRFWRKNRNPNAQSIGSCVGVDLNRNFDFNWSEDSSSLACSDTFHGRGPFSEPETAAIRDIINEHRGRLALYTDIHAFGSMILYGYGDGVLPPNALILNMVAVRMAQAIDAVKVSYNPNYVVGNVVDVLYRASGSSIDFAKAVGVPLAYTYELPARRFGSGTVLGFLVDPDFIEQAGMETWEGIKAGARYARDSFRG